MKCRHIAHCPKGPQTGRSGHVPDPKVTIAVIETRNSIRLVPHRKDAMHPDVRERIPDRLHALRPFEYTPAFDIGRLCEKKSRQKERTEHQGDGSCTDSLHEIKINCHYWAIDMDPE